MFHGTPGLIATVYVLLFVTACSRNIHFPCFPGKNDGTVKDVQYFQCLPKHGIFVRADKLIWDHRRSRAERTRNGQPAGGARRLSGKGKTVWWVSTFTTILEPVGMSFLYLINDLWDVFIVVCWVFKDAYDYKDILRPLCKLSTCVCV